MKLYLAPGTCSLASHIMLIETGAAFTAETVNIREKVTATGADFRAISPRGAVPVLQLDDGQILTEGVAIMQYVCDSARPGMLPAPGTLERARLHEALNYVSTEVHKTYSPLFRPMDEAARTAQLALLDARLAVVEGRLSDGRPWMTGYYFSPADAYFYTVTGWSQKFGHDLSAFPQIVALRARVAARPAVQAAEAAEATA